MICWLSSYPRSGNTMLRLILRDVFNVDSYSMFQEDELEPVFGKEITEFPHKWTTEQYWALKNSDKVHFIKTHLVMLDHSPAIYLIRNGRNAMFSYARMMNVSLEDVILGQNTYFPNWNNHVLGYAPQCRSDCCMLRYESMAADPDYAVRELIRAFGWQPKGPYQDKFDEWKVKSPTVFVGKQADYADKFTEKQNYLFERLHGEAMRLYGYR